MRLRGKTVQALRGSEGCTHKSEWVKCETGVALVAFRYTLMHLLSGPRDAHTDDSSTLGNEARIYICTVRIQLSSYPRPIYLL